MEHNLQAAKKPRSITGTSQGKQIIIRKFDTWDVETKYSVGRFSSLLGLMGVPSQTAWRW